MAGSDLRQQFRQIEGLFSNVICAAPPNEELERLLKMARLLDFHVLLLKDNIQFSSLATRKSKKPLLAHFQGVW